MNQASDSSPDMDRFCGRSLSPIAPGAKVLLVTCPALVRELLTREYEKDEEKLTAINTRIIGLMDAVQANPVRGVVCGTVSETGEQTGLGMHRLNADVTEGAQPLFETDAALKEAQGEPLRQEPGGPAIPAGLQGDGLLAMFASSVGIDATQFEQEHPWFSLVGLSDDEKNSILLQLGETTIIGELQQFSEADFEAFAARCPGLEASLEAAKAAGEDEKIGDILVDAVRKDAMAKPCERFYLAFPDDDGHRRMLRATLRAVTDGMAARAQARQEAYAGYL